jgi:hypothetical protein
MASQDDMADAVLQELFVSSEREPIRAFSLAEWPSALDDITKYYEDGILSSNDIVVLRYVPRGRAAERVLREDGDVPDEYAQWVERGRHLIAFNPADRAVATDAANHIIERENWNDNDVVALRVYRNAPPHIGTRMLYMGFCDCNDNNDGDANDSDTADSDDDDTGEDDTDDDGYDTDDTEDEPMGETAGG